MNAWHSVEQKDLRLQDVVPHNGPDEAKVNATYLLYRLQLYTSLGNDVGLATFPIGKR